MNYKQEQINYSKTLIFKGWCVVSNETPLVRWPYGLWDLDGNWYPNPLLNMSAEEQLEHNEKCGYE